MDMVCVQGGADCIIDVWPGDDGGGGAGGISIAGRAIGGGGGGGAGSGGGTPGRPYTSPEECKNEVCEDAHRDFSAYCRIATKNPTSYKLGSDKAFEYYSKCLRSCTNGDWSWLDTWNGIWE